MRELQAYKSNNNAFTDYNIDVHLTTYSLKQADWIINFKAVRMTWVEESITFTTYGTYTTYGDRSSTETRESGILCFQLNKQLNLAILQAGQLSTNQEMSWDHQTEHEYYYHPSQI